MTNTMKSLTKLLLLLAVIICVAQANRRCASSQRGTCVAKESRCATTLNHLECPRGKKCCVVQTRSHRKLIRKGSQDKTAKRKCKKQYTKSCIKENGICVHYKNNDCTTETNSDLCKGASCTCCLNSLGCTGTKTTPKCAKKGGCCIKNSEKSTCRGKLKKKLCKGKYTCCINPKLTCQCGIANEARIIGGEVVSPQNKYPWMVGIYIPRVRNDSYWCGGSIIKDNYILTAAHCLHPRNTGGIILEPSDVFVAVADHDQFSGDDNISGVTDLVEVEELIMHENYDVIAQEDSDIALLKLKEPLDLSTNKEVKPVCLPQDDNKTYEGEDAIAAGWGTMTSGVSDTAAELMEVTVPILSPACESDNHEYFNLTQNMLCAGFTEGEKDSCQGDSGGPLVVKEGEKHVQVGVVSFGKGCAEPDLPGIYTRVSKYLDWIDTNTKDGLGCS